MATVTGQAQVEQNPRLNHVIDQIEHQTSRVQELEMKLTQINENLNGSQPPSMTADKVAMIDNPAGLLNHLKYNSGRLNDAIHTLEVTTDELIKSLEK